MSLEPVAFRGDWRPGLVNPVDLALVGVVQGWSSVGIHEKCLEAVIDADGAAILESCQRERERERVARKQNRV